MCDNTTREASDDALPVRRKVSVSLYPLGRKYAPGMDTQPTWAGPAPADITAWTLVQVGHLVGRRFHVGLADLGLTPTQFGVLIQLDQKPGMTNAEVARAVLVTPQSMSELMASLVTLGFVTREVPPGRGHPVAGQLTAAGTAALARCLPTVEQIEQSLGLTREQRGALNRNLHMILNAGQSG